MYVVHSIKQKLTPKISFILNYGWSSGILGILFKMPSFENNSLKGLHADSYFVSVSGTLQETKHF
jgi:hypothetical protein